MNHYKENFWLILLVSALVSLPMFATDIYISSLPAIQQTLAATAYAIKQSLSVYMAGFATATLLAGILSDFFSKYWVLTCGLFLFLISSVIIANTDSVNALIIFRGLEGLGAGMGTVLARLILKERLVPSEKFTELHALTIVVSSISISPLLGPIFGAILTKTLGWQSIFYFLALVSLVLFICMVKLASKNQSIHTRLSHSKIIENFKVALTSKHFMVPALALSLAYATEFIFISESSFVYQVYFGFNMFEYSVIATLVLLSFLIGSSYLSRLVRQLSALGALNLAIGICCLASLLPLLTFYLNKNLLLYTTIVASMISMMGVGIVAPLTQSAALNFAKAYGSTIAGLFFFIELILVAIIGYIVTCFKNPVLPMVLGISTCWIILGIIQLSTKNSVRYDIS